MAKSKKAKASDHPSFRMIVENGRLVPAFPDDQERLMSWRNGTKVLVEFTVDADRPLIRKWWAILGQHMKGGNMPWDDKETASEAVKLALGMVVPFKNVADDWSFYPRSLTLYDDAEIEEKVELMRALLYRVTGVQLPEWRPEPYRPDYPESRDPSDDPRVLTHSASDDSPAASSKPPVSQDDAAGTLSDGQPEGLEPEEDAAGDTTSEESSGAPVDSGDAERDLKASPRNEPSEGIDLPGNGADASDAGGAVDLPIGSTASPDPVESTALAEAGAADAAVPATSIDNAAEAIKAIPDDVKPGDSGTVVCGHCGGALRYIRATNGHVRMGCAGKPGAEGEPDVPGCCGPIHLSIDRKAIWPRAKKSEPAALGAVAEKAGVAGIAPQAAPADDKWQSDFAKEWIINAARMMVAVTSPPVKDEKPPALDVLNRAVNSIPKGGRSNAELETAQEIYKLCAAVCRGEAGKLSLTAVATLAGCKTAQLKVKP